MTWLDDLVQDATRRLDDRVREALYARGVSDEQIALYQIGFLDRELPKVAFPEPFIEWCQGGRKLDGVFLLPLTNTLGEVRGLQFRHVERERGGYSTFIPEKGEAILFGLAQAVPHMWSTRRVIPVEGAFDLFPVQRVQPGVLSTMSAHIYDPLLRVLRRLVDEIWLAWDNDETGIKARKTTAAVHGNEFNIGTINWPRLRMPNGKTTKDPSEVWETVGDAAFAPLVVRKELTNAC